jgi:hypothetical protein
VAAPLLRDRHRQWLAQRFPAARFVLVVCQHAVWEARLRARAHTISAGYARRVLPLWEPPSVPHATLDTSADGPEAVRRQLRALLDHD